VELARAMSQGESETFVPATDDNYIPWGYHNEIKSIIKSKRFCPVFITGLSGNGKTTMIEQVCASLKRECVRVNFTAATDEDELLGGFRLINGETRFVPGPVLVAMERGAVLLLDEIDLGGHLIMCLQSVLEGKGKFIPKIGKYVRPAPGFTVLATANTKGKGSDDGRFAGTNILNEAFLDRFAFTYEQDYADPKIEKKILKKVADGLNVTDDDFLDNLVTWADIIRKSFKQQVVSEIITTRRLRDIVFAYSVFGDKMTAIQRCVSRFDETTKDAFTQMYTKVDADAQPKPTVDAAAPKTDNPNACPF
jgi:Mg-chelatase subunit ChlI